MNTSWSNWLNQALTKPDRRVAVVGVGSELYGDDAAGVLVARRLKTMLTGREDVLIIEGGIAPENCTGALRRFAPNAVIFVDAAEMNLPPGEIRWLAWDEIAGVSASTHSLPLSVLADYVAAELQCEVYLIGIQPALMAFDAPVSSPVTGAVDQVVSQLATTLVR
ncbi:MAG TPA: hydrogenase maturation peptidase HycI [Phototrophicaceae bacterium]|nr:hydrogenase maturation peptidase HycI [Phototrophicaceae bacterium]